MSSKYSFYNIKKSDVLDLYNNNKKNNNNVNMDIDMSDGIYIFDDLNSDKVEISIYIHENDLIMQECCFQTGEVRLFRDNEDGTLSVLYECRKVGDLSFSIIYTPSNAYNIMAIGDKLNFASYISAENFEKLIKLTDMPSKVVSEMTSKIFISNNAYPFVVNGNILNTKEYEAFKKLYTRYSIATKYIPASNILNNLLSEINQYIATGNFNKDCIFKEYINLQNFQELCYDSISTLAPFVNDPSSVDLRSLTEKLQRNLNNISNLLDIYLENELRNEDVR